MRNKRPVGSSEKWFFNTMKKMKNNLLLEIRVSPYLKKVEYKTFGKAAFLSHYFRLKNGLFFNLHKLEFPLPNDLNKFD